MMHCFKNLESCKKSDLVQRTLNDGKTGEEGPLPTVSVAAGCLGGNKRAKAERNAVKGQDVA
jgi:hypothetical protein